MVAFKRKLKFIRQKHTDLTDSQWQDIKDFLDIDRKRKYSLRSIIDASLYINRTGLQWRNLPVNYPPWELVYYYFRTWTNNGTWSAILRSLVCRERERQGRNPTASMAAVDSQSVKIGSLISIDVGIDGHKRVNGRKRHLAVDILGLPLAIHVSSANEHDTNAGLELLWQMEKASDRLDMINADHAYLGTFSEAADYYDWKVCITQKPESASGFIPQSGRWQVERSFAWFNFFRRLSRDFEKTPKHSVTFIQLMFIDIILARLDHFKI